MNQIFIKISNSEHSDLNNKAIQIGLLENGELIEYRLVDDIRAKSLYHNIYKAKITDISKDGQYLFVAYDTDPNDPKSTIKGHLLIKDIIPQLFKCENTEELKNKFKNAKTKEQKKQIYNTPLLVQVKTDAYDDKKSPVTTKISFNSALINYIPYGINQNPPNTINIDKNGVIYVHKDNDEYLIDCIKRYYTELKIKDSANIIVNKTASVFELTKKKKNPYENIIPLINSHAKIFQDKFDKILREFTNKPFGILGKEHSGIEQFFKNNLNTGIDEIIFYADKNDDNYLTEVKNYVDNFYPDLFKNIKTYPLEEFLHNHADLQQQLSHPFEDININRDVKITFTKTEAVASVIHIETNKQYDFEKNYKLNCKALEIIVKQLRLRSIGGQITVNLLPMQQEKIEEITIQLKHLCNKDTANTEYKENKEFSDGSVSLYLTRKRTQDLINNDDYIDCVRCSGKGINYFPKEKIPTNDKNINLVINYSYKNIQIDVNRSGGKSAYKANKIALETCVKLIKERDLHGLINIDLLNMKDDEKRKLESSMREAFTSEGENVKVIAIAKDNMMQVERKIANPKPFFTECNSCYGIGKIHKNLHEKIIHKKIEEKVEEVKTQAKEAINNQHAKHKEQMHKQDTKYKEKINKQESQYKEQINKQNSKHKEEISKQEANKLALNLKMELNTSVDNIAEVFDGIRDLLTSKKTGIVSTTQEKLLTCAGVAIGGAAGFGVGKILEEWIGGTAGEIIKYGSILAGAWLGSELVSTLTTDEEFEKFIANFTIKLTAINNNIRKNLSPVYTSVINCIQNKETTVVRNIVLSNLNNTCKEIIKELNDEIKSINNLEPVENAKEIEYLDTMINLINQTKKDCLKDIYIIKDSSENLINKIIR